MGLPHILLCIVLLYKAEIRKDAETEFFYDESTRVGENGTDLLMVRQTDTKNSVSLE
jgi:hypothetical protein